MEKFKKFLMNEYVLGYTLFERVFLLSMLLLQVVVFIIQPDTPLGIISGISGVISVVLCAKGKISFYYIGFVQTISYMILAWNNKFYGEVMENVFYLVTMVIGIFIWNKNLNDTGDGTYVKVNKMSPLQWVLSIIGTLGLTFLTGLFLNRLGNNQAYTDAATNVFAIFAQILMIKRYKEQWIWWLLINLFCVKMWYVAGNYSMVAMYIAWIANTIYGWHNWSKLNKISVDK